MAIPDISKFTFAELEALKGSIDSAIGDRRQAELETMYSSFEKMAEAAGFTLDEVLQSRKRKAQSRGPKPKRIVRPKYRNPNNTNQVWTGRGRKPAWVVAHLASGGDVADFLI